MADNPVQPEPNRALPQTQKNPIPKPKKKKINPQKKNSELIPLLLIVGFGTAIFFLLQQFNANQSLINLYLINVIAIFVGYCFWFFIGRIEGGEFAVFGFKIKAITGSFFGWLFVFVMGIIFFNPSPKPVIIQDDKIVKGLSDYSGLDLKIKVEPTKSGSPLILDNFVDVSKYISSISSSPADTKPQRLDITFQFPDSIATPTSQISLLVNNYTYQRMVNPTSATEPLTHIRNWAEILDNGEYLFKHPFKTSIPISITLWK